MTKSIFLSKLEKALEGISEQERKNILKKYEAIIDEEVEKGRTQKDIIEDLGNVDLIAKLYMDRTNKSFKKPYDASKFIDSILSNVEKMFEHLDDAKAKLILKIICFSAIGIIILSLIGIPFQIMYFLLSLPMYFLMSNHYLYSFVQTLIILGLLGLYIFVVIWFVMDYIQGVVRYLKGKHE